MSYTLSVYALDLEKVISAVGSCDESLLRKIVRANPDEFDDEDDFEPGSGPLLLVDALRNLLAGKAAESHAYSQHGYALEELCRHLSKKDHSGYVLGEQVGVLNPFLDRTPVPLPPSTGFPRLGYLRHDELKQHLDRIEQQWIGLSEEELDEDAKEILQVMKQAAKKKWDVVFVYG